MSALGVISPPFPPITKVFGPVVTFNIALRLAPAVSASSMCLVLRRWTRWWPAAFFGGLLYGFSASMDAHLNYLFLTFAPLPPLIFLLVHEVVVRQSWRPGRRALLRHPPGFPILRLDGDSRQHGGRRRSRDRAVVRRRQSPRHRTNGSTPAWLWPGPPESVSWCWRCRSWSHLLRTPQRAPNVGDGNGLRSVRSTLVDLSSVSMVGSETI